jgi:MFS family permease
VSGTFGSEHGGFQSGASSFLSRAGIQKCVSRFDRFDFKAYRPNEQISGKILQMSYLSNRAVNIVNLHFFFRRLSYGVGEIFGILFLIEAGIKIEIALLIWAGNFLIRLFVRPFAFKLQQKIGLKNSVIFGAVWFTGLYPLMLQIDGLNLWVPVFMFYFALADVFYWLPYHAYFARIGDSEHRGKQLGVREIGTLIAGSLGPALGGFLIENHGFGAAFYTASGATLIAALIMLRTPEVSPGQPMGWRTAWHEIDKTGLLLYMGDSFGYNLHNFCWNIVLFFLLGNYQTFGLLLALAVGFQAIGTLLLGRAIDRGRGATIMLIGCVLVACVAAGRAFFGWEIPTIIALDALAAIAFTFYAPAFNTAVYNSSKNSHNSHWFQFFAETGWDFGSIAALATAGTLVALGVELRNVLFISLLGLGLVFLLLRRFYRTHAKIAA